MKPFSEKGFTLIEVVLVVAIIGIVSFSLVSTFNRRRVSIIQEANKVVAYVRDAQTKALYGFRYQDTSRCGYGVHQISNSSWGLFMGPDTDSTNCTTVSTRNFNSPEDTIITTYVFADPSLIFKQNFTDIFFEAPDPKTYINNNPALGGSAAAIVIGGVNSVCASAPQECRTVCVYPSGRIEAKAYTAGSLCP